MIAPDGSPEYQMTSDELVREADERGDSLSKALAYIVDEFPTSAEQEKEDENNRVQAEYEGARDLWEKIEEALQAVSALLHVVVDEALVDMGMTAYEVSELRREVKSALEAEPVDPFALAAAKPVSKAA